jgi:hypothetical protein
VIDMVSLESMKEKLDSIGESHGKKVYGNLARTFKPEKRVSGYIEGKNKNYAPSGQEVKKAPSGNPINNRLQGLSEFAAGIHNVKEPINVWPNYGGIKKKKSMFEFG